MCAVLASLFVVAAVGRSCADDATHTVDVTLSKPKKPGDARVPEPLDKVRLHVWLPGGVPVVRGAVFNPFNEKQPQQAHWQEAARLWGFAVVGANYFGVNKADFGPTLTAGLKQAADELKRPELANVPLCLVGMLAGAGMCMGFADQLPDRTLAVAPVCLEVGPSTPATRGIPTLTIFGEKDGKQMPILLDKLPAERKQGALWAVAVQWGKGHEFAAANNLIVPFFDSVIDARLPADAAPAKGPVALRPIDPKTGYFARPDTWADPDRIPRAAPLSEAKDDGDRLAGWLPDRDTAAAWRAFVGKKPPVAIRSPAPLGGGNVFEPVPAGKPFKVTVTGCRELTELAIHDGHRELADLTLTGKNVDAIDVTVPGLKPGVYTLLAIGHAGEVRLPASRPVAVIVK